jgi:hypothetical protein
MTHEIWLAPYVATQKSYVLFTWFFPSSVLWHEANQIVKSW